MAGSDSSGTQAEVATGVGGGRGSANVGAGGQQQAAAAAATTAGGGAGGGGGEKGLLMHGLIGLSSGGLSETIRNSIQDSISSLANNNDHPNHNNHNNLGSLKEEKEQDAIGDLQKSFAKPIELEILKTKGQSLDSDTELENHLDPDNIALQGLRKPKNRDPHHLLTLPPEILLHIIRCTPFADIISLRRTCKALHSIASPAQIRLLLGPQAVHDLLQSHCGSCLTYNELRNNLILSAPPSQGTPFPNQCITCARKANDARVKVGRKVDLADNATAWVCRWCGWPICAAQAHVHEQFHQPCYKSYNNALLYFFILGWLQLSFGIVAAALAWRYFRGAVMVFAPTVTSFLLLWICLGFLLLRGNRRRTYNSTFCLELIMTGLWVPPIYYIATKIKEDPEAPVAKPVQASLAMFSLNLLFRFFNLLGNLTIVLGADLTRRHRPGVSILKKAWYKVACFLVFWTYPQALEQKFPPDYL